jgi:hypothetical protein
LAIFGAKFAPVRPNPALIAVRGLPSDGTAAPRAAPYAEVAPAPRMALHSLEQAHTRLRVRYPRKGLEGCEAATAFGRLRPNVGAGARKRGAPESPVFCGAKNAPK